MLKIRLGSMNTHVRLGQQETAKLQQLIIRASEFMDHEHQSDY